MVEVGRRRPEPDKHGRKQLQTKKDSSEIKIFFNFMQNLIFSTCQGWREPSPPSSILPHCFSASQLLSFSPSHSLSLSPSQLLSFSVSQLLSLHFTLHLFLVSISKQSTASSPVSATGQDISTTKIAIGHGVSVLFSYSILALFLRVNGNFLGEIYHFLRESDHNARILRVLGTSLKELRTKTRKFPKIQLVNYDTRASKLVKVPISARQVNNTGFAL